MKLKHILVAVLAFLSNTQSSANGNYIQYHREINKAESYFLQMKMDSAVQHYRQVMEQYDRVFAKDCFIAAQVAAYNGDTLDLRYFLHRGFLEGIHWECLELNPIVNKQLTAYTIYRISLKKMYEEDRDIYYSKCDFYIRAFVSAMMTRDNIYKCAPKRKEWNLNSRSLLDEINDINIMELNNIVKKFGFPGEHATGIDDPDYDLNNQRDTRHELGANMTALLFFHNPCGFQLLKQELIQAIRDGELHPREYALIYEWSYFDLKRKNTSDTIETNLGKMISYYSVKTNCVLDSQQYHYNIHIDPEDYSEDTAYVNKCRDMIGIASLQHDEKKRAFEQKYGFKLFFGVFNQR